MNIKRPFAPALLNKLDNFLLLNKPSAWSARAHLVVYYSLLFILALSLVYYAVPDDPRSNTTVYVWVGFISIICILALITWLIYLLRFNVFKRYGIVKPGTTLASFLLYLISTLTITSFCFIPLAVETIKANQQYTSNELVNDINNVNLKIAQLEYDSLPKNWRADSLRVRDTLAGGHQTSSEVYYNDETTVAVDSVQATVDITYLLVDTAALAEMKRNGDSLQRLDDTTYIQFVCPNYKFLNVSGIRSYSNTELLTSEQIFDKAIKAYVAPDRAKVKAELHAILDKYYYADNEKNYYDVDQAYYEDRIRKFYNLRTTEEGIEHIAERKYRWYNYGEGILWAWFYTSFVLSLLVFAFRHSTARVFFLSLLSITVIFILTMLFMAFVKNDGLGYYLWMIFYFLLFLFISATTFGDRKRKAVKGIAINLFVFMLPFMPLVGVGTYYEWLRNKYDSMVAANFQVDYEIMFLNFFVAQVAGPLIFLVLLATYVHRLYRRSFGLPEE